MTSTWRRVIRLAVEWSRERVGIWSKTAWSGQGCAGCRPERKRCWTYEPPTSMASGMPSGTSTSRRRMNGFTAKYGRLGEVNPVVTPYFNIHTVAFPGGEIAGQITVVPEPASLTLLTLGLGGILTVARFGRRLAA